MSGLKHKVIIGSLSLSTFLIMGTAYAYTDASVPLQNWYKANFQLGKNEVNSRAINRLNESEQAMKASADEMLSSRIASLMQVQVVKSQQAKNRVEAVNQDYVSQIESTVEQLTKSVAPAEFDKYVRATSEKLELEVDQLAADVLQDSIIVNYDSANKNNKTREIDER